MGDAYGGAVGARVRYLDDDDRRLQALTLCLRPSLSLRPSLRPSLGIGLSMGLSMSLRPNLSLTLTPSLIPTPSLTPTLRLAGSSGYDHEVHERQLVPCRLRPSEPRQSGRRHAGRAARHGARPAYQRRGPR